MREILYKKETFTDAKKEQDIVSWIKTHPRFKWSTLCPEIGVDKGQFCKMLKAGVLKLPDDKIVKIKEIIKDYGYGK